MASGCNGSDVVDLILMTTLRDHDPGDSPLVVLPCGHAWTVDTLDGVAGLVEASFFVLVLV